MSSLQRIGRSTETDENPLVLDVNLVARAAVATFGIAGIIISIATLVEALLS